MCTLYKQLGIDAGLTTAYHPQANGQVEHKNQEVEAYLCLFIDKRQDDWADLLLTAEFVVNSHLNSGSGHAPFKLLYGYTPDFTIPAGCPTGIPLVDKCLQHLCTLRIDAEAALCLSKQCIKNSGEQCRKPYKFQVGEEVWLQAKQINIHQQSAKLRPKQHGHFAITEVLSDIDYKLALPPALKIHDVFHLDRLSPYRGNEVNGLTPPPPEPVIIDGEKEYEVDHIRDSKLFGCTIKYLISWKGYNEGEDTWEPLHSLKHSAEKVQEFHVHNPSAPRQINAFLYMSLPWQPLFTHTLANVDVVP